MTIDVRRGVFIAEIGDGHNVLSSNVVLRYSFQHPCAPHTIVIAARDLDDAINALTELRELLEDEFTEAPTAPGFQRGED